MRGKRPVAWPRASWWIRNRWINAGSKERKTAASPSGQATACSAPAVRECPAAFQSSGRFDNVKWFKVVGEVAGGDEC